HTRCLSDWSSDVCSSDLDSILHVAHRGLESLTMDREVLHFRDGLIPRFADLIYNGYWFSPEREMIQASIDAGQKDVTGTARVKQIGRASCRERGGVWERE